MAGMTFTAASGELVAPPRVPGSHRGPGQPATPPAPPVDLSSPPPSLAIEVESMLISASVHPGQLYQVVGSDDGQDWTAIGPEFAAENSFFTRQIDPPNTKRHLQLVHFPSKNAVAAWGDILAPGGLYDAAGIFAGPINSAAIQRDGSIVAWGDNSAGQLNFPPGLTNVVDISCGRYFMTALRGDGKVVAWGYNGFGETNVPSGLAGVRAIRCGDDFTVALKQDGTVVAWGFSRGTKVPAGLTNVVSIAVGADDALALRQDGTVAAWGYDTESVANVGLTGVKAIAVGGTFLMALKEDGTVTTWGVPGPPPGLSNVVAIAAGDNHAVALRRDGTVAAFGYVVDGDTTVPDGLTNVIAIAAAGNFNIAEKSDGTLVGWGSNSAGQLNIPRFLHGVTAMSLNYSGAMAIGQAPSRDQPQLSYQILKARIAMTVNTGTKYQLLASPDIKSWAPEGDPFVAQTNIVTHEIDIGALGRFFELQEVP